MSKVELTETLEQGKAGEAWPDDITHKGKPIFEAYMKFLEDSNPLTCKSGLESGANITSWQESYLGYIAKGASPNEYYEEDAFITVSDIWGTNEKGEDFHGHAIALLAIEDGEFIFHDHSSEYEFFISKSAHDDGGYTTFYTTPPSTHGHKNVSAYKGLKGMQDIHDLRLD